MDGYLLQIGVIKQKMKKKKISFTFKNGFISYLSHEFDALTDLDLNVLSLIFIKESNERIRKQIQTKNDQNP